MICACAYLIYTLILTYALFFALSKLFSFWNIDSGNAQSAPFWMRLPYIYSSQIVSTVVALSVCALLFKRAVGSSLRSAALLSVCGTALAVLPQAIFLLVDSLRIDSSAKASADVLYYVTPIITLACSEQLFFRRLLCFDICGGKLLGVLISCAALFAFSYTPNALYMIDLLLLHLLLIYITKQHGDISAMLFRICFNSASTLLIAPAASELPALIAHYPVSEPLLTGGANGIGASLALTLLLLVICLICALRSFPRDGISCRIPHRSSDRVKRTRREA